MASSWPNGRCPPFYMDDHAFVRNREYFALFVTCNFDEGAHQQQSVVLEIGIILRCVMFHKYILDCSQRDQIRRQLAMSPLYYELADEDSYSHVICDTGYICSEEPATTKCLVDRGSRLLTSATAMFDKRTVEDEADS